jgi:hypothetical protein
MAPTTRKLVYVLLPTIFFLLRNLCVLPQLSEPDSRPLAAAEKKTMNLIDTSILGSPESTTVVFDDCQCELVSINCLDAIQCLPSRDLGLKRIQEGTIKRRALRRNAIYWDADIADDYTWAPIGKAMQSISIQLWREWMKSNHLPSGLVSRNESFVNETWYPYCVRRNLMGRACFFSEFDAEEQFGDLEREALDRYGRGSPAERISAEQELRLLRDSPYDASPFSYLLHFAHVSRISLNIRRFLIDIYDERVRSIPGNVGDVSNALRVALHIRRGDSCGYSEDGYSKEASSLYAAAQVGTTRLCYDTTVYMTALRRVMSRATGRHVVVYISTDDLTSLLDEIKEIDRTLYDAVTWKYVDHSRDLFNYSSNLEPGQHYIEWAPNKAELGEAAVVDIWHLSHGQIFIGHLGSRFGKLSWWQAIARHNSFIPFYTVDGHSVCCDIDEACGSNIAAIVSMENCLSFDREHSKFRQDAEKYWTEGSTVRFQAALAELDHRLSRRQNSSMHRSH